MSSAGQFSLPQAVLSGFKESLACLVVGTMISTVVYGITVLQTYIYFKHSSTDSVRLKSFVALLFLLDTATFALTFYILYAFVVSDFGQPLLLVKVTPAMGWENGITIIIGTLAQCYFASRIWILSKGNIALVGAIILLALGSCSSGIAISSNFSAHGTDLFISSIETRVLSGFANGLSVICDILIAVSLSYYLHSSRTGFKRTDSMINRLIFYVVNRGALTTVCQAGHMITLVALPGRFIFLPFALLDGKLYCNTLLATLNAQRSLGKEDLGGTIEFSSTWHVSNSSTNTFTSENERRQGTAGQSATVPVTTYKGEKGV